MEAMRAETRRRIVMRALHVSVGFSICFSVLCGSARVSTAQDVASARQDVVSASDFRVRVSAALLLGKRHSPRSRPALERALTDTHPAVRTAAAAALAAYGESAAISALESQARVESSPSVRAQITESIEALRKQAAPVATSTVTVTSATTNGPSVVDRAALQRARYVVRFGEMRNATSAFRDQFDTVMRKACKSHKLADAIVDDGSDPVVAETARAKHLKVFLLDGNLTRLAQSTSDSGIGFQAQVEFSVRQVPDHTLKGMLSGAATSVDVGTTLSENRKMELQTMAVGGAVESALRGADQGLAMAAR
jgi:hypothetical protein